MTILNSLIIIRFLFLVILIIFLVCIFLNFSLYFVGVIGIFNWLLLFSSIQSSIFVDALLMILKKNKNISHK
jgi:hypothetical protein